jgi:hypothetical protein
MPPERMRFAGASTIGGFFASVPLEGRLDDIPLLLTAVNRQPALAAYALGDDGRHRPYGLMVLQLEGDGISASSVSLTRGCSNSADCHPS